MQFLKSNFNEVIVKLFYIFVTILFISAYIMNLTGSYTIDGFFYGFLVVNILAVYTALYSCYFLLKYSKNNTNQKIGYLKTSRKLSLIYTLLYLIISQTKFESSKIQFVFTEMMFIIIIIFFMIFLAHTKLIHRNYNKKIIWIEK